MTQLESQFKKKVKEDLDLLPKCYYFVKEALSLRGIADIIGCKNGRFFALELKKNFKEADKKSGRIVLQKHYIGKIKECGGYGKVAYPEIWQHTLHELRKL